ncbi:VIT1/CCC1 transporter family protein [Candidatus Bipolaricaulota bacterium]|nr:VIT1/CCC1 transporter family protein [Candidatus Bipolaricaulota bacterium]
MFESFADKSFKTIARRYFILNGFDGILTVLGITAGSFSTGVSNPSVLITSSLGAAIALGISGVSGAYITEKAERLKEFKHLQDKMLDEMEESIHRENVNRRSIAISIINGISPFCCAVIPTIPYFLVRAGLLSMDVGYYLSASLAFLLMASFGGFLGRISKESVIVYALKMIVVGTITAGLSLVLGVGG